MCALCVIVCVLQSRAAQCPLFLSVCARCAQCQRRIASLRKPRGGSRRRRFLGQRQPTASSCDHQRGHVGARRGEARCCKNWEHTQPSINKSKSICLPYAGGTAKCAQYAASPFPCPFSYPCLLLSRPLTRSICNA